MIRKRIAVFFLAAVLVLSLFPSAAMAEDGSGEDIAIEPGTYTVPVSLDDTVESMGADFGAVLADTATVAVSEDQTATFTFYFQTTTVFGSYTAWLADFYGYYEDGYSEDAQLTADTVSITYTTIQDQTGSEQSAVSSVTLTVSGIEDTYDVSYYLASTMMSFTRNKTITVDWDHAQEGIVEEESEPVTCTGSATLTVIIMT